MDSIELASYLAMKGYKVHQDLGFNVEALIMRDDVDTRPIDYDKFIEAAEKEGYVLINSFVWIKKDMIPLINAK